MGTAFDTFDQYAFGHFPGQLEDREHADVVTRLAVDSAIGYGLAVHDLDGKRAALVSSEYDDPTGITVRETVRDNPTGDNPAASYPEDTEMTVVRVGRVWVRVADGSTANGPVYIVEGTGAIVSTQGSNALFPNARFMNTVPAGEMALVQLNGN